MSAVRVTPGRTPDSSSGWFEPVVPTDSGVDNLSTVCRYLWVGVGGDLVCHNEKGVAVLLRNVFSGYHPIRTNQVVATGTTATDIVAFY